MRRQFHSDVTGRYRLASNVDSVSGHELTFVGDDGRQTVMHDLIVAADGASSTVRSQYLPSVKRSYAGYVAFRGTFPEVWLSPESHKLLVPYFTFFHVRGLECLIYTIPGYERQLESRRRMNWVWYNNFDVNSKQYAQILTDDDGTRHTWSLPPGGMSKRAYDGLGSENTAQGLVRGC